MRHAFLIPLSLFFPPAGLSQEIPVGTWKSYTNMTDIRDGQRASDAVLAATSGGLFEFDPISGEFQQTTNAEGLSTNTLTAVGIDDADRVWVGGSLGEIHVRTPGESGWTSIPEISQSSRLVKSIRRFFPRGDTVFIVSDFGVSVFRTDKWEFGDTYANFPLSGGYGVRDVAVFDDTLWIGTSSGLLSGWLGSLNLSAPSSWTIVPFPSLPSSDVRALLVHRDTLFVGTSNGLAVRGRGGIIQSAGFGGKTVQRVIAEGEELFILSVGAGQSAIDRLVHAFDTGVQVGIPWSGSASDMVIDSDRDLFLLMTPDEGMLMFSSGSWVSRNPDGPRIRTFVNIGLDEHQTLWAATGFDGGGSGFARFSPDAKPGSVWKSFRWQEYPVMGSNDYFRVSPVGEGSVWISSWGEGALEVRNDSIVRKIDTESNPAVSTSDSRDPSYPVMGGVAKDNSGSVWMTNWGATSGRGLLRILPDASAEYYTNGLPGSSARFMALVIDNHGTKWMANAEVGKPENTGVHFFNEFGLVSGTSATGGWGVLTKNEGLADNYVISLVVDHDGDVWVGTALGVTIITTPLSPRSGRRSSFPLREQSIQTIAVDAVNRKWVGTKEGVFVVSPDGSQLLSQFTVANTGRALISNDVRSIAIDDRKGIVYMGTEKGLSALWIAAVRTERTFSTLSVSPNPFMIPSSDPLSIGNLVEGTSVKILTIDGRKVVDFPAQGGGRAFWDGRDERDSYVGSGVYLIIAHAENGDEVVSGKVVVISR